MGKDAETSPLNHPFDQLLKQEIAPEPVCPDNDSMDHRPQATASAAAPDIDEDAQGKVVARPETTRRIRRPGPPSAQHLSLARNLQRDIWKVADADDRVRRIEDTYGFQKK